MKIKTKNNFNYYLRDSFTLRMLIKTVGDIESYWQGTFRQTFSVSYRIQKKMHIQVAEVLDSFYVITRRNKK